MFKNLIVRLKEGEEAKWSSVDDLGFTVPNHLCIVNGVNKTLISFDEISSYSYDYEEEDEVSDPRDNIHVLQ